MPDPTPDPEAVLHRFNRLMQELLEGSFKRNCFRPWEIELLLDIEACKLTGAGRREMLRRYQKAVQRHFERGGTMPLKLSEYLERLRARRRRVSGVPGADSASRRGAGANRG